VYDDWFSTVPKGEFARVFDTTQFAADDWERLVSNGGLERADIPEIKDGNPVFRLDDEWRSPDEIERQREAARQQRLEQLANPEDIFEPPPLVSREPATPLRYLNPEDDPLNFLDDDDVRVTFDDGVAPPIRDLTGNFQDEAAVEPRPRQRSPPPALQRSTRDRRPNRKFKGDEWTNFQLVVMQHSAYDLNV
jgi:hypothetical protein